MAAQTSAHTYLIDTNSIIELMGLDDFGVRWPAIEGLVNTGRLKTVVQVFNELGKFPSALTFWKVQKKKMMAEQYSKRVFAAITKVVDTQPQLYDVTAPNNSADPWLIAVAFVSGHTIITSEKRSGPNHTTRIPWVCTQLNVRCIDCKGFMTEASI